MNETTANSALVTFAIYLLGVFVLAWLSSRVRRKKEFVGEYFLGGRSLGLWAFALTFAATSSSGGSFMGFPSLVYTHGWVLALWIASYMLVPLVGMGLLVLVNIELILRNLAELCSVRDLPTIPQANTQGAE